MIDLAIALGITIAENRFGRSKNTARIIAASEQRNGKSRRAINDIAQSTDELMEQIALRGRLLAETMKNDNLRRFKKIENERLQILS